MITDMATGTDVARQGCRMGLLPEAAAVRYDRPVGVVMRAGSSLFDFLRRRFRPAQ